MTVLTRAYGGQPGEVWACLMPGRLALEGWSFRRRQEQEAAAVPAFQASDTTGLVEADLMWTGRIAETTPSAAAERCGGEHHASEGDPGGAAVGRLQVIEGGGLGRGADRWRADRPRPAPPPRRQPGSRRAGWHEDGPRAAAGAPAKSRRR